MKTAIYLSGITGSILFIISTIGIIMEFPLNYLFPILGLILLLFVYLPLMVIHKFFQNKKVDKITDSYKGTDNITVKSEKGNSKTKGWGMNNSPYRERRSGVNWGGGNIHGANASRGIRKSFLK